MKPSAIQLIVLALLMTLAGPGTAHALDDINTGTISGPWLGTGNDDNYVNAATGVVGTNLNMYQGGNDTLLNLGTVNGQVWLNNDDNQVTNSGSVGMGISTYDGDDAITNTATGHVGTDIGGGGGNDTVTNAGTVEGNVKGGNGADVLDNQSTGTVGGNLDGGSGHNIINNSGTVTGSVLAQGGDDQITNSAGGTVGAGINAGDHRRQQQPGHQ